MKKRWIFSIKNRWKYSTYNIHILYFYKAILPYDRAGWDRILLKYYRLHIIGFDLCFEQTVYN